MEKLTLESLKKENDRLNYITSNWGLACLHGSLRRASSLTASRQTVLIIGSGVKCKAEPRRRWNHSLNRCHFLFCFFLFQTLIGGVGSWGQDLDILVDDFVELQPLNFPQLSICWKKSLPFIKARHVPCPRHILQTSVEAVPYKDKLEHLTFYPCHPSFQANHLNHISAHWWRNTVGALGLKWLHV